MLAFATAYAMLLGIVLLGDASSPIIQFLELGDKLAGNKATGWCLIMLSLACLLAYFSGRISVRWSNAYELMTKSSSEAQASFEK
jgi:hypothetical protein